MRVLIAASAAGRIDSCPASAALPQAHHAPTPESLAGTAMHATLEAVARGERVDVDCANILQAMGPLDWLESEVAYGRERCGTARRIGTSIHRAYRVHSPHARWAGTADLVGAVGDQLMIADLKTGRWLGPASESAQLRMLAVLAWEAQSSRSTGSVRVGYIYLRRDDDGAPPASWHTYDAFDLSEARQWLADLDGRVADAEDMVAEGKTPTVSEGDHCRYCPAYAGCPAKRTLAMASIGRGEVAGELDLNLTPERVGLLLDRLSSVEGLCRRLRRVAEQFGEATRAGKRQVYQRIPEERIEGASIGDAIASVLGDGSDDTNAVVAAISVSLSKADLGSAISARIPRGRRKLVAEQIIEACRERGALREITRGRWVAAEDVQEEGGELA